MMNETAGTAENRQVPTLENGINLDRFLTVGNIAKYVDEEELVKIGFQVLKDFAIDKTSREDWEKRNKDWMDLATQVVEEKTEPFEGAANIKYPLLSISAVQFAAKSGTQLIQGREVVKGKVVGSDPDGRKASKANRIGSHMSYQILEEMEDWEDDMDSLLVALPIEGCEFKKTYFKPSIGRNVSEWVRPEDLVVNYKAKTLRTASRITHIYYLTKNEIIERERSDMFLPIEYGLPSPENNLDDDDAPYTFYEQHRYWDLDNDGYKEPYIVTVNKETEKVVRIVARWDKNGIQINSKKEIRFITPVHYFTRFIFLPSPDGGIYGQGYGSLLGPLNQSINMTINQLHDAGTLANLSGKTGLIGKGVSLKPGRGGGKIELKIGEFKNVNYGGEDIRKSIWQAQFGEPSIVLFQLLGLLISAGEKLGNVTDPMVGESPGANVPATTTLALIEQGSKVYSAVFKRIYRALKHELKKLYRLNMLFLPETSYYAVLDDNFAIKREDYNEEQDVMPIADPNQISKTQQLVKAQALIGMLGMGLNDEEIKKRYLEALEIQDIDKIIPQEGSQPPQDPKQLVQIQKLEIERDELELKMFMAKYEMMKLVAESIKAIAQAEAAEEGIQLDIYKNTLDAIMQQFRQGEGGNADQGRTP